MKLIRLDRTLPLQRSRAKEETKPADRSSGAAIVRRITKKRKTRHSVTEEEVVIQELTTLERGVAL